MLVAPSCPIAGGCCHRNRSGSFGLLIDKHALVPVGLCNVDVNARVIDDLVLYWNEPKKVPDGTTTLSGNRCRQNRPSCHRCQPRSPTRACQTVADIWTKI